MNFTDEHDKIFFDLLSPPSTKSKINTASTRDNNTLPNKRPRFDTENIPKKPVNNSRTMVKKFSLSKHVGEYKELAVKHKELRKELLQEKTKNEKLQQKIY